MSLRIGLIAFLLFTLDGSAQESTGAYRISGSVVNYYDAEPLEGVTIVIEGTTLGTTSDANGSFNIHTDKTQLSLWFAKVDFCDLRILNLPTLSQNRDLGIIDMFEYDYGPIMVEFQGTIKPDTAKWNKIKDQIVPNYRYKLDGSAYPIQLNKAEFTIDLALPLD